LRNLTKLNLGFMYSRVITHQHTLKVKWTDNSQCNSLKVRDNILYIIWILCSTLTDV
jgi:hypothetical protein